MTQKEAWLDPHHLEYHAGQFRNEYRSTVHLTDFVRRNSPSPRRALDVCCGACATLFHVSRAVGGDWTGIDFSQPALDLGARLLSEHGVDRLPELVSGDMYDMTKTLPPESFDLVLCAQTLSWLPDYERALQVILRMLRRPGGVAVFTSLFSECFVDAKIEITEYPDGNFGVPRGPAYYNVYSLERFRMECIRLGARDVIAEDFVIDIDLPVPESGVMGTFTRTMHNGQRLQFSGPLLLPWKFIAVHI